MDDQEWTAQSIESVLRPKGHVVLKAHTGQQALDLVSKVSPDAILVDVHLPDFGGIELVRRLKSSPTVHPSTPVLLLTSSLLGRAQRLEGLSAGVWDILTHPIDASELILRLDTFIDAKQEADRVRDQGLTDPATGFYNVRGILQRTKEISADAIRHSRPVTCLAFGRPSSPMEDSDPKMPDDREAEEGRRVAIALRDVTRVSDTIGRLSPGEFVVIAPGTDRQGAVRLADRVIEALRAEPSDVGLRDESALRAGLCALDGGESTSPEDLLLRATMALRQAQAGDGSFRVRAYEA